MKSKRKWTSCEVKPSPRLGAIVGRLRIEGSAYGQMDLLENKLQHTAGIRLHKMCQVHLWYIFSCTIAVDLSLHILCRSQKCIPGLRGQTNLCICDRIFRDHNPILKMGNTFMARNRYPTDKNLCNCQLRNVICVFRIAPGVIWTTIQSLGVGSIAGDDTVSIRSKIRWWKMSISILAAKLPRTSSKLTILTDSMNKRHRIYQHCTPSTPHSSSIPLFLRRQISIWKW